jgi:hypothetical protein
MARIFEVKPGPHSYPGHIQWAIQAHDLTGRECVILRAIVTNQYMNSEDYKMKQPASPFLQGFELPRNGNDGWVLIEFWTEDRTAIDAFVSYINKRMNEEK